MPKPNLEPLNLGSISKGALLELFESSILKIGQNIADSSTDATAPRTLTLKLRFIPDQDRRGIKVETSATCGLAAIAKHTSRVYIGKDEAGTVYMFGSDPRQDVLFQQPEPEENLLNFKTTTSN